MRKLIKKHNEDKKKKRNQLVFGIILILIMMLSLFGYSFNRSTGDEKISYEGIDFIKESGIWKTTFQKLQLYFLYTPGQAIKIDNDLSLLNSYRDKPLYIYSENLDAKSEIYKNLFYYNEIVQRMQDACPEEEKCKKDLPFKSCKDNFIIIKENESENVYQSDNCVYIYGSKEDLVKLTDSFLFKIFGITQ